MKNFYYFVSCLLLMYTNEAISQTIYVQSARYTSKVQNVIKSEKRFEEIVIVYGAQIDPRNTGRIDLKNFERYIQKTFPSINESAILCIDLENKLYRDIKTQKIGSTSLLAAQNDFLKLLRKVKELRPNIKVGFYGLPYKMMSANEADVNAEYRIHDIVKESDILFPSLYLSYSPNQAKGVNRNKLFLELNLSATIKIGLKNNKPVVPFIWYRVHPANKKYGGELLSNSYMKEYISFIQNYKYLDRKINGIVYWEPNPKSQNYKDKNFKSPSELFDSYLLK